MKHANVAIFVPHAGCPHQCSFCDQRRISGQQKPPSPDQVGDILAQAAKTLPDATKPAQIAFFGGSFTSIERDRMEALLQAAYPFIDGKTFYGVRISARPDAMEEEILDVLKAYKVTDIELGIQSMNDGVLSANLRGHTAEDASRSARRVKSRGFGLGLQMMTGLYTDTAAGTFHTAERLAELEADYVRVYPTVVLRSTRLEELYRSGIYRPAELDAAVEEAADLLGYFTQQGIPVIRMGLHDSPDLVENLVAGPYHPAFRELCESRLMLRGVLAQIADHAIAKGKITIFANPASISRMTGQKRENIEKLKRLGYDVKIVTDDKLGLYEAEIR